MSASNAIIEKILNDAKAQSESIINDAKAKAEEIKSKSLSKAKEYKANEIETAKNSYSDIERRKITVANLEVRKIMLQAKQEVITDIFESALKELKKLTATKYKSLIASMLSQSASDGDKVVICKEDSKVITSDFISKIATKLKIKLSLSKEYGNFVGGIILQSKNYDKNLTLDVELETLREEIEHEVANILFGE